MKGGETRAAIAAADSVLPMWRQMTAKASPETYDAALKLILSASDPQPLTLSL